MAFMLASNEDYYGYIQCFVRAIRNSWVHPSVDTYTRQAVIQESSTIFNTEPVLSNGASPIVRVPAEVVLAAGECVGIGHNLVAVIKCAKSSVN